MPVGGKVLCTAASSADRWSLVAMIAPRKNRPATLPSAAGDGAAVARAEARRVSRQVFFEIVIVGNFDE
ncbi:hypothetical protein [Roseateles aquatilis]|uniref:hypothetical protein n=1 Tax=Roseateles aquatilis TaxID=431061 RepID=UPI001130EEFE|nr:hypothetical protein [Roseateles aquatilis]